MRKVIIVLLTLFLIYLVLNLIAGFLIGNSNAQYYSLEKINSRIGLLTGDTFYLKENYYLNDKTGKYEERKDTIRCAVLRQVGNLDYTNAPQYLSINFGVNYYHKWHFRDFMVFAEPMPGWKGSEDTISELKVILVANNKEQDITKYLYGDSIVQRYKWETKILEAGSGRICSDDCLCYQSIVFGNVDSLVNLFNRSRGDAFNQIDLYEFIFKLPNSIIEPNGNFRIDVKIKLSNGKTLLSSAPFTKKEAGLR